MHALFRRLIKPNVYFRTYRVSIYNCSIPVNSTAETEHRTITPTSDPCGFMIKAQRHSRLPISNCQRRLLLSLIALFLFTFYVHVPAQVSHGPKEQRSSWRFRVAANGSYRYPLIPGDDWNSYGTAGASISLPTSHVRLRLNGSLEHGSLRPADIASLDWGVIHSSLFISYSLPWKPWPWQSLGCAPVAGITNMTIYKAGAFSLNNTEIFASSENEFGLLGGISLLWRHARLFAEIAGKGECILSQPTVFTAAVLTIRIGGSF